MSSKQTSIASFFGGGGLKKSKNSNTPVAAAKPPADVTPSHDVTLEEQDEPTATTTAVLTGRGAKRGAADKTGKKESPQDDTEIPTEKPAKGLKRLRKAADTSSPATDEPLPSSAPSDGSADPSPGGAVSPSRSPSRSPSGKKPQGVPMRRTSPSPPRQNATSPQARKKTSSTAAATKKKKAQLVVEDDSDDGNEVESEVSEAESEGGGEDSGSSDKENEDQAAGGKKKKKTSKKEDGGGDALSAMMKTAKTSKPEAAKAKGKGKAKAQSAMANVGTGSLAAASTLLEYDPAAHRTWKEGSPTPYIFLASTFESIAEESKRLIITRILCNCFRTIIATRQEDLLAAVYLSCNQLAPSHEGTELGIGDSTLIQALADATGSQVNHIKSKYQEEGDLGVVAMGARSTQKTMFTPPPLTLQGVLGDFRKIAATEGKSSMETKKGVIKKLLVASRECEAGYIIRSLQGKLRIGLAQASVLTALAHAVALEREAEFKNIQDPTLLADKLEEAVNVIKQVYSECPSYDAVVPALLSHGVWALPQHCHFQPGVPVAPMLAKPTTGVREVLDRFSDCEFSCEYKYDGERAQVHVLEDGSVRIFSRNSEDNTGKFPDIIDFIPGLLKDGVKSVVLDCEAVAFDREEGKILPFQVLSTRSRKQVAMEDIKVQVCLFAFDCLFLNGRTLLQDTLIQRRELMTQSMAEEPGKLIFARERTSRDVEELQTFLEDSIKEGTEGLIVKALDTTYEPSKRSLNWLKLKKDYMDTVGDSLDLVVIGGYHGRGKRTGVYGAFLLACYDQDQEEYQAICKIGTGFSEAELISHAEVLKDQLIPNPPSYVNYGDTPNVMPDVWFEPKVVWEVKAADLSISPVHRAALGLVDPEKGIALRFPRFIRVRDDKTPEMATSAEQVADMYKSQAIVQEG